MATGACTHRAIATSFRTPASEPRSFVIFLTGRILMVIAVGFWLLFNTIDLAKGGARQHDSFADSASAKAELEATNAQIRIFRESIKSITDILERIDDVLIEEMFESSLIPQDVLERVGTNLEFITDNSGEHYIPMGPFADLSRMRIYDHEKFHDLTLHLDRLMEEVTTSNEVPTKSIRYFLAKKARVLNSEHGKSSIIPVSKAFRSIVLTRFTGYGPSLPKTKTAIRKSNSKVRKIIQQINEKYDPERFQALFEDAWHAHQGINLPAR